jgi:uncharacterized protein involved in response to NO
MLVLGLVVSLTALVVVRTWQDRVWRHEDRLLPALAWLGVYPALRLSGAITGDADAAQALRDAAVVLAVVTVVTGARPALVMVDGWPDREAQSARDLQWGRASQIALIVAIGVVSWFG